MIIDVENGAVHLKVAIVSAEPGAAATIVRKIAKRTPRSCAGTLVDAGAETQALVGFDYYVPGLELATGELAHPTVTAIDTLQHGLVRDREWAALFEDADIVVRLGPSFAALELALRLAPGIQVAPTDAKGLDATLDRALRAALTAHNRASSTNEGGATEAVGSATITCPWCLEPVEITIEADVDGTFVQDCEVCCRPWTMHVGHDDDGELRVDVERA